MAQFSAGYGRPGQNSLSDIYRRLIVVQTPVGTPTHIDAESQRTLSGLLPTSLQHNGRDEFFVWA